MERSNIKIKSTLKAFGGLGGSQPPKCFFGSFLASKKNNTCFFDSL